MFFGCSLIHREQKLCNSFPHSHSIPTRFTMVQKGICTDLGPYLFLFSIGVKGLLIVGIFLLTLKKKIRIIWGSWKSEFCGDFLGIILMDFLSNGPWDSRGVIFRGCTNAPAMFRHFDGSNIDTECRSLLHGAGIFPYIRAMFGVSM